MSFLFNLLGGLGGQVYIYLALVFGGFGAGTSSVKNRLDKLRLLMVML